MNHIGGARVVIVAHGGVNDEKGVLAVMAQQRLAHAAQLRTRFLSASPPAKQVRVVVAGAFGPHFNVSTVPHCELQRRHLLEVLGVPEDAVVTGTAFAQITNTVEEAIALHAEMAEQLGWVFDASAADVVVAVTNPFHRARAECVMRRAFAAVPAGRRPRFVFDDCAPVPAAAADTGSVAGGVVLGGAGGTGTEKGEGAWRAYFGAFTAADRARVAEYEARALGVLRARPYGGWKRWCDAHPVVAVELSNGRLAALASALDDLCARAGGGGGGGGSGGGGGGGGGAPFTRVLALLRELECFDVVADDAVRCALAGGEPGAAAASWAALVQPPVPPAVACVRCVSICEGGGGGDRGGDDGDVDETGVAAKDIDLVVAQAKVSRAKAVHALRAKNNRVIDAVIYALQASNPPANSSGNPSRPGAPRRLGAKAKAAWGTPRPAAAAGSRDGYSMSVFVFPPGAEIPLHDHPEMRVFTRVLQGTLRAETFDVLEQPTQQEDQAAGAGEGEDGTGGPRRLLVRRNEPLTLTAGDVASLDERRGNIHAFTAGPQGAAMLDVFLPDYDPAGGRDCTYYEFDAIDEAGGGGGIWLRENDDCRFVCKGGRFGKPPPPPSSSDDDDEEFHECTQDSISA